MSSTVSPSTRAGRGMLLDLQELSDWVKSEDCVPRVRVSSCLTPTLQSGPIRDFAVEDPRRSTSHPEYSWRRNGTFSYRRSLGVDGMSYPAAGYTSSHEKPVGGYQEAL